MVTKSFTNVFGSILFECNYVHLHCIQFFFFLLKYVYAFIILYYEKFNRVMIIFVYNVNSVERFFQCKFQSGCASLHCCIIFVNFSWNCSIVYLYSLSYYTFW